MDKLEAALHRFDIHTFRKGKAFFLEDPPVRGAHFLIEDHGKQVVLHLKDSLMGSVARSGKPLVVRKEARAIAKAIHDRLKQWNTDVLANPRKARHQMALKLAHRHLSKKAKAQALITVPYLEKLIQAAISDPGWGESSPAATLLRKLARDLKNEFSGVSPFPISELWQDLEDAGVDEGEMALLKSVPMPRAKEKKQPVAPDFYQAYVDFGRVSGKNIVLVNIDMDKDGALVPQVKAWEKALAGIKNRHAKSIWNKLVHSVALRKGSRGSEDASFGLRKQLVIVLAEDPSRSHRSILTLRSILHHELGHALHEKEGKSVLYPLYGNPPFISPYAEKNYEEDFAETFREFVESPRRLKQVAPTKYRDMQRRLA